MKQKLLPVGVLLVLLLGLPENEAEVLHQFQRLKHSDDPDLSSFYIPTLMRPQVMSLAECALQTVFSLSAADYSKRATAFAFNPIAKSCVLGLTLPFHDAIDDLDPVGPPPSGLAAVYFIKGVKPLSSEVHSDLFAYILLNKEKQFDAHANVNLVSPMSHLNSYSYTLDSPVTTVNGNSSPRLNEEEIELSVTPHAFTSFSVLAWHKSLQQGPGVRDEAIVTFSTGGNWNTGWKFILGGEKKGSIDLRLGNDNAVVTSGQNVVSKNTWTYVAAVYDYSQGKVSLYKDGDLVHTETGVGQVHLGVSDTIHVGRWDSIKAEGNIASIEVYDRALQNEDAVRDSMDKSTTYRVGLPTP